MDMSAPTSNNLFAIFPCFERLYVLFTLRRNIPKWFEKTMTTKILFNLWADAKKEENLT
jgi:hypothetical protein